MPLSEGDLFQLLRDGIPRTRSELAAATGIARSTVASHIDTLMRMKLLRPAGESISIGGRPPTLIAFNPSSHVVLTIEVGLAKLRAAITDLGSNVLCERRLPLPASAGPEAVLNEVIRLCGVLLTAASRQPDEVAGVGIALPGLVQHHKIRGIPEWDGFDVISHVQRSLPVPVFLDSSVNLMALGERSRHWPDHDNVIFLSVAESVKSAIISSGHLQRGADSGAGDLGHVQISRRSELLCTCGSYGCLQTFASISSITRQLRDRGVGPNEDIDVLKLVAAGDPLAIRVSRQAGRDIGEVLAVAVTLLNPSLIVVGGNAGELGEQVVAGIREVIYKNCPPLTTSSLHLATSIAGDRAAIYGASHMVRPRSARGRQPCPGAFGQPRAFILGQRRKHVKDQFPVRAGRVQPGLSQRPEADTPAPQDRDDVGQVRGAAPQPGQVRHYQDVARLQVFQTVLPPGPRLRRTRCVLHEDLDSTGSDQRIQGLPSGTDSGITNHVPAHIAAFQVAGSRLAENRSKPSRPLSDQRCYR